MDLALLVLRVGIGISFVFVYGWAKMSGGPAQWADLSVDYAACAGDQQSPIDLTAASSPTSPPGMQTSYAAAQGAVFDTGHAIQVNTTGGTLTYDGTTYELAQFHVHAPSEHIVDGSSSPAEIHFVHQTGDSLAVLGVFVEEGSAANPALDLFRSRADMVKQATRAKRMPSAENTFRNLNLNQRVSTVSPFVSPDVWTSCGGDPESLDELVVYAGLDLSARTDLTACVLVGRDADGVAHVWPYFWTPEQGLHERAKTDRVPYDAWVRDGWLRTTPGATVDYSFVATEMAEIMSDLNVELVAFDRWRIDVFKKDAEGIGADFPLSPFGQGFKDMSPALDTLEADLLNGRIRHGGHPVLTMCAANAVITKDAAGNRKLDKPKATGRIDGMVALAMALGCAGSPGDRIDLDAFLSDPLVL